MLTKGSYVRVVQPFVIPESGGDIQWLDELKDELLYVHSVYDGDDMEDTSYAIVCRDEDIDLQGHIIVDSPRLYLWASNVRVIDLSDLYDTPKMRDYND